MAFAVLAGRIGTADQDVVSAAHAAARAASLRQGGRGGRADAQRAAEETLRGAGIECASTSVSDRRGPAEVTATVSCAVKLSDLVDLALPGQTTITADRLGAGRRLPGWLVTGRPQRLRGARGTANALIIVGMTGVMLLAAGLAFDGSRVLAARREAVDVARQAARAGAQAVDIGAVRAGRVAIDPARAVTVAESFLSATGHRGQAR